MVKLEDLVKKIEERFHVTVYGKYYPDMGISAVCLYPDKNNEILLDEESVLYVDECPKGAKLTIDNEELPLLIIGDSDSKGHSLNQLVIKESLKPMEVIGLIQNEIVRHSKLKRAKDELFHAVVAGKGIEELTAITHKIIGNPITVCNTSFSVIASSPKISDEENLEYRDGRQMVKEEKFMDMLSKGIIDHLYHSAKPYVTEIEGYDYEWVFKSIQIRNKIGGYICVRASVKPFTQEDLTIIDVLSQMLSIELQKDDGFSHPTGLWYEFFLKELLEGHVDRVEAVQSYFSERILDKKAEFFSVFVLESQDTGKKAHLKSFYDQIRGIFPDCAVILFRGDLVVVVPSATTDPFGSYSKDRFTSFLELNQLNCFVSYPFSDLKDTPLFYEQAKNLIEIKPKSKVDRKGPYTYYRDNYMQELFSENPNKQLLKMSIHPDIWLLLKSDRENGTEFLHTLKVYLEENRSTSAASKKLHIHKSTFFYRVGKMEDLFNINLKNADKLFAYEYSLRLLDYIV